jgi:hypothetical protein
VSDPIAILLKFGFLAVLYLFLFWIARSATRDLSRLDEGSLAVEPGEGAREGRAELPGAGLRGPARPRLEVVAAMGHEPGVSFDISRGATLGRSEGSDILIHDPFASSAHARIFSRDGFMYIEDMGSTNGTYLNGRQIRTAERLRPADVVRIGDTEYRYTD